MKPRIRILHDGYENEPYWCGLFTNGYLSLGRVSKMSLQEAINFYALGLRAHGVIA